MKTEQPFYTSEVFRTALSSIATTKTMRTGRQLFRHGEPAKGIFLVRSGKVSVWVDDERAAADAGPGSALGLPATIAGIPYILNARVTDDAEVAFVSRERFMRALEDAPELRLEVLQILGSEVQSAQKTAFKCDAAVRLQRARHLLADLKSAYVRLPQTWRNVVQEQFRACSGLGRAAVQ